MEGSCGKRDTESRNPQDPLDRAIAALALRQHGVVALAQLVELGLSPSAVGKRATRGRLHRVHRGVFAVGHAGIGRNGRIMAAVLACGSGAAASHRTAAALRNLGLRAGRCIEVTAPGARGRTRPGIRVHGTTTLDERDVELIAAIPCTSLARTLLDIAETSTRREVERACDRAEVQQLLDMAAIDDVLQRAAGRRGAPMLTAVLREHRVGATVTRSELEELFLACCRKAGRPPDGVNAWIPFPDGGGAEADFLWRAQRLVAEVDGRGVHTTRRAFEADRRRDQRLTLLGWRVVRFTWRQVVFDPAIVRDTLRALL